MWSFRRERLNQPTSPRRVLLMFREVSTCDPTTSGPNRPLIGARLREQDAIATEALHPGFKMHWIGFDITEDPGTRDCRTKRCRAPRRAVRPKLGNPSRTITGWSFTVLNRA